MSIYPDFAKHNYQVIRELGRNRQAFKIYEREIQILQSDR